MHQTHDAAHSTLEPVTDVFHGVPVTDPYRWLEDQILPHAKMLEEQTAYTRTYLQSLPVATEFEGVSLNCCRLLSLPICGFLVTAISS